MDIKNSSPNVRAICSYTRCCVGKRPFVSMMTLRGGERMGAVEGGGVKTWGFLAHRQLCDIHHCVGKGPFINPTLLQGWVCTGFFSDTLAL